MTTTIRWHLGRMCLHAPDQWKNPGLCVLGHYQIFFIVNTEVIINPPVTLKSC